MSAYQTQDKHRLLNYPYQARKVSGLVFMCWWINCVSFYDFSIEFWNRTGSVIYLIFFSSSHSFQIHDESLNAITRKKINPQIEVISFN
jgi:hypothetical protein